MTIALAIAMTFSLSAQSDLTGIWNAGQGNTKIELQQNDDGLIEGKVISSDNPKAKIGKVFLKDIKRKDGEWTGKMYVAKKQKWYDATFERQQDKLEVTLSVGFFSKTLEWKRQI